MSAEFRIDWNYGYSLYDVQTNECLWRYRYSQLKGSSDDGISTLKLLFRDEKTGGIETRVRLNNIVTTGAVARAKRQLGKLNCRRCVDKISLSFKSVEIVYTTKMKQFCIYFHKILLKILVRFTQNFGTFYSKPSKKIYLSIFIRNL